MAVLLLYGTTGLAVRNLSCDLSSKGSIPKVVLIGEDHSNQKSKEIRKRILQDGAQGKYPVASEASGTNVTLGGALHPFHRWAEIAALGGTKESGKIHGIESTVAFAVYLSYYFQLRNISSKTKQSRIIAEVLLHYTAESPLFAVTLERMKRKARAKEYSPRLGALIESFASTEEQKNILALGEDRKNKVLESAFSKFTPEELSEFAAEHHKNLIALTNEKYLDYYDKIPLPVVLTEVDKQLFGCRGRPCQPSGRFLDVMRHKRDRDFAYNISELLCHYSSKESQMVVIVGAKHMDGTSAWLKKIAGDQIEIVQYRSDVPEHEAKIFGSLSSQPTPRTQKGQNPVRPALN